MLTMDDGNVNGNEPGPGPSDDRSNDDDDGRCGGGHGGGGDDGDDDEDDDAGCGESCSPPCFSEAAVQRAAKSQVLYSLDRAMPES